MSTTEIPENHDSPNSVGLGCNEGLGLRATENKMQWIERRDADYLVGDDGKILGRVACSMGAACLRAEAVYAGGGNHRMELGDYISNATARAAVEAHVRDVGLPGTEE